MQSVIVPAILTLDEEELVEKVRVLAARGGAAHIDVLDGELTPTTSVNLFQVVHRLVGLAAQLELEVHLIVRRPQEYLAVLRALGAGRVVLHQESFRSTEELIASVGAWHQANIEPVLSCWPDHIPIILGAVHSYQVMGVTPGRAGQTLLPDTVQRVATLQQKGDGDMIIAVDGGVNFANGPLLSAAGARRLVLNTAFWQQANPDRAIKQLIKGGYGLSRRH